MRALLAGGLFLVLAVGAPSMVRLAEIDSASTSELSISPVVPPQGGFAVESDQMDQTLLTLLGPALGMPAWSAGEGQPVLIDSTTGELRRAVQTGAAIVDTGAGKVLVEVDLRRSPHYGCSATRCDQIVRTAAAPAAPRSVAVVVDRAGVQVQVRAWAGPGRTAVESADAPALSTQILRALAAHPMWRR